MAIQRSAIRSNPDTYVQCFWTQLYNYVMPRQAPTAATITDIRRAIPTEVFSFQQLMDCLAGYAKPRDKIGALLRRGDIIRVRKGLYVFGPDYRRGPWSREVLANLIYGPSYISLDYALAYYALIPERVEEVTSVTLSRSRRFDTPLGRL